MRRVEAELSENTYLIMTDRVQIDANDEAKNLQHKKLQK